MSATSWLRPEEISKCILRRDRLTTLSVWVSGLRLAAIFHHRGGLLSGIWSLGIAFARGVDHHCGDRRLLLLRRLLVHRGVSTVLG